MNRSSLARYIWIKSWVVILNSLAPLSILYCIIAVVVPPESRLPVYIEVWLRAEAIFYFLTLLYQRFHLERDTLHPELDSLEERRKLFNRCLNTTYDYEQYISKWFLGAPLSTIKRDNVKEFFRWAFLNLHEHDSSYDEEVEEYMDAFEARSGFHFEPGRSDVRCLRLTFDEVNALHRSLIWYMAIFVVDLNTCVYLYWHHFRHYRASAVQSLSIFPPRPHVFALSRRSSSQKLSYWYRPHTSRDELPILFLHGIGVGLYPYMDFLTGLNEGPRKSSGDVGILAIEILPISSRITSPIARKEAMCEQIRTVLEQHDMQTFVLMSHSYGSVIATHLLKTPHISSRISAIMLVDPISLLLHQPDVAYNFTFRSPISATEWLLWYFGSKDMGTAHTLARQFFWYENVLWKEDLIDHPSSIFLSANDAILNAPVIREYLEGASTLTTDVEVRKSITTNGHKHIKAPLQNGSAPDGDLKKSHVVWGEGLDHGQMFDTPIWRKRLSDEILRLSRLGHGRCF